MRSVDFFINSDYFDSWDVPTSVISFQDINTIDVEIDGVCKKLKFHFDYVDYREMGNEDGGYQWEADAYDLDIYRDVSGKFHLKNRVLVNIKNLSKKTFWELIEID